MAKVGSKFGMKEVWGLSKQGSNGGWYAVRPVTSGRRGPFASRDEAIANINRFNLEESIAAAGHVLLEALTELLAALDDGLSYHDWDPDGEVSAKAYKAVALAKGGA